MFANVGYGVYGEYEPTDAQLSLVQTKQIDPSTGEVTYPVEIYLYLVCPDWTPPDQGFVLTYEYEAPPFVDDVVYDSLESNILFDEGPLDLGVVIAVLAVIEAVLEATPGEALDEAVLEEPPPTGAAAGLVTLYIQNPPITHEYLTNLQAFVEIEEQFGVDLSFPEGSDENVPVLVEIVEITNLAALVEFEDEPGLDRVDPDEADTNLPDLTIIPFLLDDAWVDPVPDTPSLEEEGDNRLDVYDETVNFAHGARISLVTDRTQTYIAGHGLEFELQLWIDQTPTSDIWSGTSGQADTWTSATRQSSQFSRVVRTPPDSGVVTISIPPGPAPEPPTPQPAILLDESGNPIMDEGGNILEEE